MAARHHLPVAQRQSIGSVQTVGLAPYSQAVQAHTVNNYNSDIRALLGLQFSASTRSIVLFIPVYGSLITFAVGSCTVKA